MPNTRSKFSKNPISLAAALAALLVCAPLPAAERLYTVSEVLTGDTFRLDTGTLVTYASIAAPPLKHSDPKVRDYGQRSLEFNRSLLQGKKIRVEFGSQIKNADGVYQGFIFLEDGSLANLTMVEAGYAKLAIVPPNLQHAEELRRASTHSRRDGKGLWEFENKIEHRFLYVADKMTRKYHFEGCRELEGVSKAHLDRFESSVAAKAAGFSFCKECRHLHAQETDLF